MLKGINLTLMIGPGVPLPVPPEVIDALTSVTVKNAGGETASGFELKFTLNNRSPLHTLFLLSAGAMLPIVRVIIIVTFNGTPSVLMDGVMLKHETSPGTDSSHAVLTIKGEDLTALMDLVDFSGDSYPAMPDCARVAIILAKYSALGIVPKIIPEVITSIDVPVVKIPKHKGKDLAYIKELAQKDGYVFYLDPGPLPGKSIAYWGPEIKVGIPQPALNINMDAHTNVETLSFNFDKEKKETPIVYIKTPISDAPMTIPVPDITPLNPPLGLIPPIPPITRHLKHTAKLSPAKAALEGYGYAASHADAVFGSGSLDVLRYGHILKARRLVGVRGAGMAFDGLYYVRSVTHSIRRGEYKQSFELSRNGLVSTVRQVPA